MRSSILNPLFATAASLPGIGPKTAKFLDRLLAKDAGEARVLDLVFHLPYAAIDRRNRPKIADAPLDTIVTLEVKAIEHRPPGARSKAPYKVLVEDETGDILLVFFLANHHWIEKSLPLGETRWISGKLRTVGRASPDRASRPRAGQRRLCQNGAGRASLSFNRGALSKDARQGDRCGADQNPRLAGVA